MDNRLFNVNGSGDEMLKAALSLVFNQEGIGTTCKSWIQTKQHGLILLWIADKDSNELPVPTDAETVFPLVSKWLEGDFAKEVILSNWCEDFDHDGSNSKGWQVYCEDWGHVAGNNYAICAIKPAYIWHGK